MSYDIYGNPLQRGHCEVHPHVHEEYPCSVCIQESNNRNAHKQSESDHYEMMELRHGLELSQQRIAELEQELVAEKESHKTTYSLMKSGEQRGVQKTTEELQPKIDQLAATVDVLREYLRSLVEESTGVIGWHLNGAVVDWDEIGATDILGETNESNLNAVRRDVYADGYYQGFSDAWHSNFDWEKDHVNYGLEQSEIKAEQEYPNVKE